ncbi:uncharacterized protein LOC124356080 [Homalodisca vitripennis]|uniref:uncharacterized protein LOC124356080 n=1 Tax=Homalodisca vitripennis TaxID=197043 RepID=UPI001EEB78D1|nr:uncharacterized protein LOC124356080 [Homalodisca vitripennis]
MFRCAPHSADVPSAAPSRSREDLTWRTPSKHVCHCGRQYSRHFTLVRHMRYECGKTVADLACSLCDAKFKRNDNLTLHYRLKHNWKVGSSVPRVGSSVVELPLSMSTLDVTKLYKMCSERNTAKRCEFQPCLPLWQELRPLLHPDQTSALRVREPNQ